VALVFISALILHYGNFYFMLSFRTQMLHFGRGVFFVWEFMCYLI